jgi:hypothetical protein
VAKGGAPLVGSVGTAPGGSDRGRDLAAWEARLEERERRLAAQEALPPRDPGAAQLAQIEAKLAELRAAEQAFLRTQEELAVRSEAVAARERLVSARERELDEAEVGTPLERSRGDLAELEARLRRLERSSSTASEDTQSFAKGLESLRRRGTRRPPTG